METERRTNIMKQGKWYVSKAPRYESWQQGENKKIAKHQVLITGIPLIGMIILLILG